MLYIHHDLHHLFAHRCSHVVDLIHVSELSEVLTILGLVF